MTSHTHRGKGCGVAKLGPWWDLGFAHEWTTPPPFAGVEWLSKLFIRDAKGGDYRTTPLASLAAHSSAVVEFGAPLLVLFGGPGLKQCGIIMLLAMHVYIVAHFAHADVYGLNWMTAHCLYYCHIHTPAVEFGSVHSAALLFLIAEFV